MFELDADLLALATDVEGHPDNVAASLLGGFVICADGGRPASTRRPASRRWRWCRSSRCARRAARAALPAEVPIGEAVFNMAHAALLTLGLARGDWDLLARGLQDRLHQQRRAHLFPRSMELAERARLSVPSARRSPAPARPCSSWCFYEQTGAVAEALAGEVGGWARVLRAPFEPQGAYVEAL